MHISELLEAVNVTGANLLAYVITVGEAYAEKPRLEPEAVPAWKAVVASNQNLMKKLQSKVKVEFTPDDPYATDKDMMQDAQKNKRLKIWTGASDDHPVFSSADNHIFRTVHDYFAHIAKNQKTIAAGKDPTAATFTIRGEFNAYLTHVRLAPKAAVPAFFTEILGQACYFFVAGNFPEQKVAILDGFDYYRLGVTSGARKARVEELVGIINDRSQAVIPTKIQPIERAKINWKLLNFSGAQA